MQRTVNPCGFPYIGNDGGGLSPRIRSPPIQKPQLENESKFEAPNKMRGWILEHSSN